MKSLKILVTLVAVLAMAATAFGEFTISLSLEYLGEPVPGLSRYMVKMGGVMGFRGIAIDGAVHQAWGWSAVPPPGSTTPTPTNADPLWGPGYINTAVDTHLMINDWYELGGLPTLVNPCFDSSDNETCSLANEYGVDDGYGGQYFKFGMGTYTSRPFEGFATSSLLPEGTDVMQIVIPTGTGVIIDGWVYEAPGVVHEIHILNTPGAEHEIQILPATISTSDDPIFSFPTVGDLDGDADVDGDDFIAFSSGWFGPDGADPVNPTPYAEYSTGDLDGDNDVDADDFLLFSVGWFGPYGLGTLEQGDADLDGDIDFDDFLYFSRGWFGPDGAEPVNPTPHASWSTGDFDLDGDVDGDDYLSLCAPIWPDYQDQGFDPPAGLIPEPSTIVMLMLGALCLAVYRVRM